jgi:hypothetical protein
MNRPNEASQVERLRYRDPKKLYRKGIDNNDNPQPQSAKKRAKHGMQGAFMVALPLPDSTLGAVLRELGFWFVFIIIDLFALKLFREGEGAQYLGHLIWDAAPGTVHWDAVPEMPHLRRTSSLQVCYARCIARVALP